MIAGKNGVILNAELNTSVSHCSIEPSSLVRAFFNVLKGTNEADGFGWWWPGETRQNPDHRWYKSADCFKFLEAIVKKLDELAPDGYYFGTTSNTTDYGFWMEGNQPLTASEDEGDTIEVYLSPEKTPEVYKRKVVCLMKSGLSKEEAERVVLNTPMVLELFYGIDQGLFAVECEAVGQTSIFNLYDGKEIPNIDS